MECVYLFLVREYKGVGGVGCLFCLYYKKNRCWKCKLGSGLYFDLDKMGKHVLFCGGIF